MDTDDTNNKNLQREIQRIRKGLKEWEHTFSTKYNRKPTMQDIENRPNVLKVYKDYNSKKKLLASGEKHSKSSKGSKSPSRNVQYVRSPRFDRLRPIEGLPMALSASTSTSTTAMHSERRDSAASIISTLDLPPTQASQASTQPAASRSTSSSSQPVLSHHGSATDAAGLTEEEAFWLQPATQPVESAKPRRKKKNSALEQKLFGHIMWKPRDTLSAALKAERDSQAPDEELMTATPSTDAQESASTSHTDAQPQQTDDDAPPPRFSAPLQASMEVDGLVIADHYDDPFRRYDPTLFQSSQSRRHGQRPTQSQSVNQESQNDNENDQDQPMDAESKDVSDDNDDDQHEIMPGLFSSARARSTVVAPMLENDPDRYCRVIEAMKNGTLGMPRQESEMDLDDDLQKFIAENTIQNDQSQQETENSNTPKWKKRGQKRQTKLIKLKFVDIAPDRK